MTYPDRYVITGVVKEGSEVGKQVWLYWTEEAGGWWQWSSYEGWAERFEAKSGRRYDDAMLVAPKAGPWYYNVDDESIKVKAVPAIVEVKVY